MILGKLYNEQKQVHGGQLPKGIAQNDLSLSTAKKISKEQKVSEAGFISAGSIPHITNFEYK
jgi:hypothetical protein